MILGATLLRSVDARRHAQHDSRIGNQPKTAATISRSSDLSGWCDELAVGGQGVGYRKAD
jgi:hypothetical protein